MISLERHYFAAANTPLGFYSCFDRVTDRYNANRIYYIKGGCGCGKSTFMKKIGGFFDDCEYFHCSSDSDSIDGIRIPKKNAAVFDGTAPHIQDPVLSGAADEIIDFGESLSREILTKHRSELIRLAGEKAECFKNACRCLAAAAALAPQEPRNKTAAFDKMLSLIKNRCGLESGGAPEGTARRLFADAFTPKGHENFFDELFTGKIIKITGGASSLFLEELGTAFIIAGYDADFLLNPLSPTHCKHLLIPKLSLTFSASITDGITEEIIFSRDSECLDAELQGRLTQKAVTYLAGAKALHGEAEAIYRPAVDFSEIDRKFDKVLGEIKSFPDTF